MVTERRHKAGFYGTRGVLCLDLGVGPTSVFTL